MSDGVKAIYCLMLKHKGKALRKPERITVYTLTKNYVRYECSIGADLDVYCVDLHER